MRRLALIFVAAACALAAPRALAQPQGEIISCPTTPVMIGATPSQTPAGWTSQLETSVLFLSAKVIGPGSGYNAPNLTCSYALLAMPQREMARIGRPVPAGMRCSVDAAVPSRFDCFPITLPPAATSLVAPHDTAPTTAHPPG